MAAAGVALAGLLLFLSPRAGRARAWEGHDLYVSPDGDDAHACITFTAPCRSVQAAVDKAAAGAVIRVASGVYTGVSARDGVTQVVYISKSVTIRGGYTSTNWTTPYPITQPTTLDAQGRGRVIYITGHVSPAIEGLRITGGDATGLGGEPNPYPWDAGGGIYVITAAATIRENQIFSNAAHIGGGAYLLNAPVLFEDNRVFGHTTFDGGGLYVFGGRAGYTATFISNTIAANIAGWAGGGFYLAEAAPVLSRNAIVNNVAAWGGGLYLVESGATLDGNTVSGNALNCRMPRFCDVSGGIGGGLHLVSSDATLRRNTISSNTSGNESYGGSGGGLSLFESNVLFEANVISGNVASSGGGLYLYASDVTWANNRIVANRAGEANHSGGFGGGVYALLSSLTSVNDVVAANWASREGGALYMEGVSSQWLHATLAHNSGGSGVYLTSYAGWPGTTCSPLVLTNTILVGHAVGVSVTAGNTATLEATLWGNQTDCGGAGACITGTRNFTGDPAFTAPGAGDYHIGPGSAARDVGVDVRVASDMDGEPRPMGWGPDLGADELPVSLRLLKRAAPDPARPGAPLTYTIYVTNTGVVELRAAVTDTLPAHILPGATPGGTLFVPGGAITWAQVAIAPGAVWTAQVVVTPEVGYAGPLTNVVQASTEEGARGDYVTLSYVGRRVYLPLILRNSG